MKQVRRVKKMGIIMFFLLFSLMGCTNSDSEDSSAIRNESPYIRFYPFDDWHLYWIEELESTSNPYGAVSASIATPLQLEAYLADPYTLRSEEELEADPNFINFVSFQLFNQDDHLYIGIDATSINDHTYTIVLFLNYEQIAFQVLGEAAYHNQFDLIVPSAYTAFIPFTLDFDQIPEDGSYRLTLAVFTDLHIHAAEWEEQEDFEFLSRIYRHLESWNPWSPPYRVLNYDLIIGEDGVESFDFVESEIDDQVQLAQSTTPDLWVIWESETMVLDLELDSPLWLDRHIEAIPGEELHFSAWALPLPIWEDSVIEDYLIISLLNGEQIPLNGKPFLYVNLTEPVIDEPIAQRIDFTITAPMEPGSYEFVSFLVPNPTGRSVFNHVPLEITPRVTIVVSE